MALNDNQSFGPSADATFLNDLETHENMKENNFEGPVLSRMSLYRQFDPLVQNKSYAEGIISQQQQLQTPASPASPPATEPRGDAHSSSDHSNGNANGDSDSSTLMMFTTPARPRAGDREAETEPRTDADNLLEADLQPPSQPQTPVSATNGNLVNGSHLKECNPSPPKHSPRPDVLLSSHETRSQEIQNTARAQELAFEETLAAKEKQVLEASNELEVYKGIYKGYLQLILALRESNQELVDAAADSLHESESEKLELIQKCTASSQQKEQAIEDVQGVENSFSELHRRYEKMKQALEACKQNEDHYKQQLSEIEAKLHERDAMYAKLKGIAEEKIEVANQTIENAEKRSERELASLRVQLKKTEMKANGLQSQLDQKTEENTQLALMVDELSRLKC